MSDQSRKQGDGQDPRGKTPQRSPRFKGGPDDISVDSLIIDATELDTAFHHVDELGDEGEQFSFRKTDSEETEMDMTPMVTKRVSLDEVPANVEMLATDRQECKISCVSFD